METFVLVHGPPVGPATWTPVAEVLRARGHAAVVPSLVDVTAGPGPYWPRMAAEVAASTPPGPLTIVPHSRSGQFVPLIVEALRDQVSSVLFVDSVLPPRHTGTMRATEPEFLEFLTGIADERGMLPRWSDWWPDEDFSALVPDAGRLRTVLAEQPRLPLDFYTEEIPVPSRWDHVRGAYLWFSEAYEETAKEAGERGWPVTRIPGEHLHMVVDPEAVADWLIRAAGS